MFSPEQIVTGILVFLRVSAMLFTLPIIGDPLTPIKVRILLGVALTFCLYHLVGPQVYNFNDFGIAGFMWDGMRELFIGLVFGFTTRIIFEAMLVGASIVGYQMGFGTATLFFPDVQQQIDGFTAFHRIVVVMIFFTLGLHHLFINGIAETFQVIPIGKAALNTDLGKLLISMTATLLTTALQLSAPILVALLFAMAGLGVVARAVPQLNVFTISFPASFFLGLLIYMASLPLFPNWMRNYYDSESQNMLLVLRGLLP